MSQNTPPQGRQAAPESTVTDLSIGEMLTMQRELWEHNKERWSPLEPKYARNSLLWLTAELGEVLDIIKKCGEEKITTDPIVNAAFTEELSDVLMYFTDVLLRYQITPQQLAMSYHKKHQYNLQRNFPQEEQEFSQHL